jgi:pentatricopeptide repeat protein
VSCLVLSAPYPVMQMLVSKYSRAGQLEPARDAYYHPRNCQPGSDDDIRVQTTFMHALLRAGELEEAREMFIRLASSVTLEVRERERRGAKRGVPEGGRQAILLLFIWRSEWCC